MRRGIIFRQCPVGVSKILIDEAWWGGLHKTCTVLFMTAYNPVWEENLLNY